MVPIYYVWCGLRFKQYTDVLKVGSPTSDERVEKLFIGKKKELRN